MGAGCFRSVDANCQLTVHHVEDTFAATGKSKPRAKALVRMLKLAIRPKHAGILYEHGAATICLEVLEKEPKGSSMRELALLTLLCLSLDAFVKRDLVESNADRVLPAVTRVLSEERPATSVKYAAIAVIHSLSREDRNLQAIYDRSELSDALVDAIAYETEGSPLRKLACEVVHALSEVKEFQSVVYRSFSSVASRVLIGEMETGSQIVEITLEILSHFAENEDNKDLILKERLVIECAIKALENLPSAADHARAKLAALTMFYNLAVGSEALALRVSLIPRLLQASADAIEPKTPLIDFCGLMAIKLLHILTIYKDSRKILCTTRGLMDILYLQSKTNPYARMAYINLTGAFDEADELNPERRTLVGCEEMDDKIVDILDTLITKKEEQDKLERSSSTNGDEADDYFGIPKEDILTFTDIARLSSVLSLSVLVRRKFHADRLRSRLTPLITRTLNWALLQNDVRSVDFSLACLRQLLDEPNTLQRESLLELLGRVQEKVHPTWRPARQDAERLVSTLGSSGISNARLTPVVSMLEQVLDDRQRGYTRSLDVPLTSLTYSIDFASKAERRATRGTIIKLLPRALDKAVVDNDALSAMYTMELFKKVAAEDALEDREWEAERAAVSSALKEIMNRSHFQSKS